MFNFFNYQRLFSNRLFLTGYIVLMLLSYCCLDRPLALYLHGVNWGQAAYYLHLMTNLGLGSIYIILFASLFIFFQFIYRKPSLARNLLFLLLALCCAGLVCDVLKIILSRARPDQLFLHQLYGFYFFKTKSTFWSFPSGHTTVVTAVMVGLSYLKPKYWPLFLVINLIIAATRILLTYHYVSDVMGAFLLTNLTVGYLAQYWFMPRSNSSQDRFVVENQ